MNLYTYSSIYGEFHQCSVSFVRNNIIAFDLAYSSYEPYLLSRLHPYETITLGSEKPLLFALKAHFQTDVIASVICNTHYLFTICLGREHMVFPVHKDLYGNSKLHLYATTLFVQDPKVVSQYMQGSIRPAYENVYYYQNTILYLDCYDLPFPGGSYFDPTSSPTTLYRILFLTKESLDYVTSLVSEWSMRNGVMEISFASREVEVTPKMIDLKPIPNPIYSDTSIVSTGVIHRKLSHTKPWLLIHDIVLSYFHCPQQMSVPSLGILVEWPFRLGYIGSRPPEPEYSEPQFVALAINQNKPTRVLQVRRPYERFNEYCYIPPGPWTCISFYLSSLITTLDVKKVALQSVVIGLAYRDTFFCLDKPVLEGNPILSPTLNTQYLLSVMNFEEEDSNITILERYKYNENYALLRVRLKDVLHDSWCLKPSQESYPKLSRLPHLVQQWVDFFQEVKDHAFSVDVGIIRLAVMLAKHNICFNINGIKTPKSEVRLTDKTVEFYVDEKTMEFVNEARLVEQEEEGNANACCIA